MLWSVQPLVRRDARCKLRADLAKAPDRTAEASALSDDVARHSDPDRLVGPPLAVRGSLSRGGARRCCARSGEPSSPGLTIDALDGLLASGRLRFALWADPK